MPSEKLSVILGHILNNQEALGVFDFSVRQTSLDEVFINFAERDLNDSPSSIFGQVNDAFTAAADDDDQETQRNSFESVSNVYLV